MEGSPHKHKRTIAQDFLTKSLSQSIELNLSLNRYSFTPDHNGPLTLRVTHHPTNAHLGDKMKKSSIQERPTARTISNLRNNLLHLEQKLSEAAKQLNSSSSRSHQPSNEMRSTVGGRPGELQHMLFVCNEVSEDESTMNMESQKMLIMKSRERLAVSQQTARYYVTHLVRAFNGGHPAAAAHVGLTLAVMKKAMILRMPSQVEIQSRKVSLNCPPHPARKTLLLELDRTLLHRRMDQKEESDIMVGSGSNKFFVSLRPYLFSFLKKIRQYYEIVIFSSLQRSTVKLILQDVDPQGRLISDCFTRQHCLPLKGDLLCKDIRIFNRNPREIAIVDSDPNAALLHPDNFIPILPYEGSSQDRELMQLERFLLKELSNARDMREVVRQRFKLNRYWQYEHWQSLIRELYLE